MLSKAIPSTVLQISLYHKSQFLEHSKKLTITYLHIKQSTQKLFVKVFSDSHKLLSHNAAIKNEQT